MKIITYNAIYIQKVDLEFIKYRLHTLPQSISSKIFENSEFDFDNYNKYDFLKFEDKDAIEYFKSIAWIIDYESIKDLTAEGITNLGRTYVEKRNKIAERLYSMTDKDEEYNSTLLQYKLINYQIDSLTDISDYKLGLLQMNLPDDGTGLRKLIRRIFTKIKKG